MEIEETLEIEELIEDSIRIDRKVKKLAKDTGHGFQQYGNLEELETFFNTDPMEDPFEPPLRVDTNSPSAKARAKGLI